MSFEFSFLGLAARQFVPYGSFCLALEESIGPSAEEISGQLEMMDSEGALLPVDLTVVCQALVGFSSPWQA